VSHGNRTFNPFYALVILTAVAFVVTTLAYVVTLVVLQAPARGQATATTPSPLMQFLSQHGESLMLWEAGVLAVTALLAMGLDRWRSGHSARARAQSTNEKQP
jgi:hypothetical protein